MKEKTRASTPKKPYLYKDESILSEWLFLYGRKVLFMGKDGVVNNEDLYPVKEEWEVERVYSDFKKKYDELRFKKKRSFVFALFRPFAGSIVNSILLSLLGYLFGIISSFAIKGFIEWVSGPDSQSISTSGSGWLYGGLIFVGILVRVLGKRRSMFASYVVQYYLGVAVRALVYNKISSLSAEALRKIDIGKVSNTISSDVFVIQLFMRFGQTFIVAPVLILGITGYLWFVFGFSSLSIPIVYSCIILLQIGVNRKAIGFSKEKKKMADQRASFLNEIVTGIKNIKFQAWESQVFKRLQAIRLKECGFLQKFVGLRIFSLHIVDMCSSLALLGFFVLECYWQDKTLTLAEVYLVISLVTQMQVPMKMMSFSFEQFANTKVALARIGEVIDTPDKPPARDDPELYRGQVRFSGFTCGWHSLEVVRFFEGKAGKKPGQKSEAEELDRSVALADFSFDFQPGRFYAVLGGVGSGKTSMLLSVLEEMNGKCGKVAKNGSIAYIGQTAFLLNASIKDNILFHQPFDEQKYKECLIKCCLMEDIRQFPGGDLTEIGERGINLSGGQKQRITIARAMYANKDIYLIDDCLSALDAEVGKKIFYDVFKRVLQGKTIIMVTHSSFFLPDVDEVLLLKNGRLELSGEYERIRKNKTYLDYYYEAVKSEVEAKGKSFVMEEAIDREDNPEGTKLDSMRETVLEEMRQQEEKEREDYDAQVRRLDDLLVNISQKKKDEMAQKAVLKQAENKGKGLANLTYLYQFLQAYSISRYGFYVFCGVLFIAGRFFADYWIGLWTNQKVELTAADFCKWFGLVNLGLMCMIMTMALVHSSGSMSGSLKINRRLVTGLLRYKVEYFDVTPIGTILNRCTKDVDVMDTSLALFISLFQFNFLQIIGIFLLMIVTVPMMIVFLAVAVLVTRRIGMQLMMATASIKRLNLVSGSPILSNVSEAMQGCIVIRSYGVFRSMRKNFNKNLLSLNQIEMHDRFMSNYAYQVIELTAAALLVFVVVSIILIRCYRISFLQDPNLLGLCINWVTISVEWVGATLFQYQELNSAVNCVERLLEMATPPAKLQEPDYSMPLPANSGWPRTGEIVMQKVNVKYREGLPLVLKDINLAVSHGEKIGILGRTGSGKSTIILALKRILELEPAVDSFIKVDGERSDMLGLKPYRQAIVLIPQDPFLLSGTVRSNIDPDNTYSDEEVEAVLQETQIFNNLTLTINRVMASTDSKKPGLSDLAPNSSTDELLADQKRLRREVLGYKVNEGGNNLSQGQRQLLCIARAIISQPKILLMDEATSNIDSKSDQIIQKIIKHRFKQSTVITIAHRLNTIIQYDRVVVMAEGKIVDEGSPKDLLSRESTFKALVMELGEENFEKMKKYASDHSLDPVLE